MNVDEQPPPMTVEEALHVAETYAAQTVPHIARDAMLVLAQEVRRLRG